MWAAHRLQHQTIARACTRAALRRSLRDPKCLSAVRLYSRTDDDEKKPFDRVLIANRGEISQRVMRTCHDLGIETVAVYSTADALAPFVQEATHRVCLGPAAASLSYLNTDAVLQAIQDTGAQAVHPGYGFLSENAEFAQRITDSGAVWLGPPPNAVLKMGDKIESKKLAADAGVTIIPGFDGEIKSVEHALQVANDVIGYPVLLKAAAGGGGKGMRVCRKDADLKSAWNVAKDEAMKFFKDDRLLLEKYIDHPHHIEFQVLAHSEGKETIVAVERECSIQRRNQKVIEESPSVLLNDQTRANMARQVRQLCEGVGYESAGTVEWLVSQDPTTGEQSFYFLEMNTRLQVEHPVTESVCNIDLVKGMLWVGAGWGWTPEIQAILNQHGNAEDSVFPHSGHAIEARVYAEDPVRGFLPSTGPLVKYVEPRTDLLSDPTLPDPNSRYVRCDSGVAMGHVVSPHYDPMLSKLIVKAEKRSQAVAGMCKALDNYVIEGVQHNAKFIQDVLRKEQFIEGDTPTSFLDKYYPDGFKGVELTAEEEGELAVAAALIDQHRRALLQQPPLVGVDDDELVVKLTGGDAAASATYYVVRLNGSSSATIEKLDDDDDENGTLTVVQLDNRVPLVYEPERFLSNLSLNGKTKTIQVLPNTGNGSTDFVLQMHGAQVRVDCLSLRQYELSKFMHEPVDTSATRLAVQSPMPGTIISFAVQPGDVVEVDQELCIVEAMKMQNILQSKRAGKIKSINVQVGASVMADEVLLEFEQEEEEDKQQAA